MTLEDVTVDTFADRVGERFRIIVDDTTTVETQLTSVVPYGGEVAIARRAPFSVVFRGPLDVVLPQRIYRMEHEEVGALDIFIVPIGPDDEGQRYEAVFS